MSENRNKQRRSVLGWRGLPITVALSILCAGAVYAKNKRNDPDEIGNRDVGKGLNFYSVSKEAELGREMVREVEIQYSELRDPVVSEYVNRVGQNLALNSDCRIPVAIRILDTDDVNAFTLPGGHLYLNSGLLLKTQTEAELAAALAHEIAHVAARHATRQATLTTIMDYGSLGLIFIGGEAGFLAVQAAHLALPLGVAKFSRSFESEADFLGVQYAYKAGYDPTAFVDLLERLETDKHEKPNRVMGMLSTHPAVRNRSLAIQRNIQKVLPAKPDYVVNTSKFNEIQARVRAIYADRHPVEKERPSPKLRGRQD